MGERGLLMLTALLLMTAPARAQKTSRPKRRSYDSKWVEKKLKKMSLEEKLGQLLMVYYFGEFTPTESPAFEELTHEVEQNHVGGFILGAHRTPLGVERGEVYPAAVLANQLQRRAQIPLLISSDFEAGTGMRLDEGTTLPSAMAVAATGDPRDAYTAGKITALEARAAGVQWIFAPVADVNDNPANPIINTRSYGEDPKRVGEFVAAFIRGVQDNGALATAKHFPGHGDVNTDSHLTLPVVPGDRARLESVELAPFRAAIGANVAAIMSGHLIVPAFEPGTGVPATLSQRILTGLLRKEMGFQGLIVTDALDMAGVTSVDSPPDAAVRAIAAGSDVLLIPPYPDAALAALEQAAKSGQLPMSRIDEAVRHILEAKARVGLEKERFVDIAKLNSVFATPEFDAEAQAIANRGVTLLRDQSHLLPLDATRPLRILLVAISGDPDPYPAPYLEEEIRPRVDSLEVLRADASFVKASTISLPPPESYDVAIVAVLIRVADRKGTVGLPEDEAALVNRVLATGKPVIAASFGNPYLVARFPAAKTWIASFGTQKVIQRAMGRAIFGQIPIAGQIPVTVPGVAKLGDGMRVAANPMTLTPAAARLEDRLKPAFDLLDGAVADRAFPGGVLAIGHHDELLLHPFGKLSYEAKSPAVTDATLYDLASLTKPIVTTTAIMLLVAQQRVDLDAPISRYLPEWLGGPNPEWRRKASVRELLLHTSGLPAHKDYYTQAKGADAVLQRVFAEPLASEPGTRVEYSDLGFMLLGRIVERLTGQSLDAFARTQIFAPLGMNHSFFNPRRGLRGRIAPTEKDTSFRKRQLRGEADDANAWAMGGVAGHAGLFATAGDLSIFAQMLLDGGIYAHRRLLPRALISQFTARAEISGSARALGWDVPTDPSSTGRYFSEASFGHNGFTGTSFWVDPEKYLFVILLTNRVYPSATNEKIRQIRPAVCDAIIEALGLVPEGAASR